MGEKEELKLSDIERLVRVAGEQVMKRLTARLVGAGAQEAESHICAECGGEARYKGQKARDLITETGEVRLERAYYYCPNCRKGFFPLDRRWGLNETIYSPELAQQMVWVSDLLPYEQAKQVFERIGLRQIPGWSIWQQTQHHGPRLKAYVDGQQDHIGIQRVVLPPPGCDHQQRKGVRRRYGQHSR